MTLTLRETLARKKMKRITIYTCDKDYLVNGQSVAYHQADGLSLLDETDTPVTETIKALDEHIKFLLPPEEPLPLGWRIREAKRLDESGKPEEAEALLRQVHDTMEVHYVLSIFDSSP